MKGLMIFVALVLGYSAYNMAHMKVGTSTYKNGIDAYMSNSPKITYNEEN